MFSSQHIRATRSFKDNIWGSTPIWFFFVNESCWKFVGIRKIEFVKKFDRFFFFHLRANFWDTSQFITFFIQKIRSHQQFKPENREIFGIVERFPAAWSWSIFQFLFLVVRIFVSLPQIYLKIASFFMFQAK